MSTRHDSQLALARYLRNPESASPPPGVEARRLQVYRDLIYNNIEGFISGGFPVLRSLYEDDDWHALVQAFIDGHRCHTPYFLEISQEFVAFVMNRYQPREADPAFLAELAHYEWVELALDVSEAEVPPPAPALSPEAMQAAVPRLSELAWVLSYRFPVHQLGPGFRPEEPGDPCFLLVYRDRDDNVCFVELNAATARLLELVRDNEGQSALELLNRLAEELRMSPEALIEFGTRQLMEFTEQSILLT